ncbi:MAG: glycosyltransferase family 4 protein [Pseudodonghicola sp.]
MNKASRNAAIWYASDGYDPGSNGINGRRMAGASFLKGFFRHADVDEFVSVTRGRGGSKDFLDVKNRYAPTTPHRAVFHGQTAKIAPVGTLYFPAPNFADHCWQRQAFGMARYSICGITHTTATQSVMRGFFDLRAGPQAEWDGVICTSRAVHAATVRNMEIAEAFLRDRFGSVPPRPQLPVIPLGINSDDFTADAQARATLRAQMQWGEDDIAVVTVARLLPYGKFDPGPLFMALQRAQEQLGQQKRLHFIACGIFGDSHSETVFTDCARNLMPSVAYHHLPGDDPVLRKQTLSAGDIFAFPIDNIQETFGLSPIEAMAAGLPVVASDWDGMRDTVSPDVGIRVPTRSVGAEASQPEAAGYLSGELSYAHYGNRLSMLTQIDLRQMTEAFVALARDAQLRRRMGAAGLRRARTEYDWSVIVPRMQDFWAELNSIRLTSVNPEGRGAHHNPVGPAPMDVFATYPTVLANRSDDRLVAVGDAARLRLVFELRGYDRLGWPAEKRSTLERVLAALTARGASGGTMDELATDLGWNKLTVERCALFLQKYGLAD